MGDFAKAQKFVAKWEGGFSDNPDDPGGATNYGISLRFLRGQNLTAGDIDGDGDIDIDDIKAMTPEAAAQLMRVNFWEPLGLDDVKPCCAAVIFDTAVNMGLIFARKMAQQALGVQVDGVWGPVTWAALENCDDRGTAAAMCRFRRARYHELCTKNPSLSVFLKGWENRVAGLENGLKNAEMFA